MKNILLIYTGGTIGMQKDTNDNSLKAVDFNKLTSSLPELQNPELRVYHTSLKKVIDSSNMDKNYWIEIAEIIKENYSEMHGFVILHGSDTMAYTASALSFMLEGLQKAVILTGSQIPIGARRTDAKENLITSIEIAASGKIKEVCVYFEDKLLRGNRTVKVNSEQFEAFNCPNFPALADVGIHIKYNSNYFFTSNQKELNIQTNFSEDVAVLKLFPGITEKVVSAVLNSVNNIVLETFGSGNATNKEWFITSLTTAINKGVFIVNCSQCLSGEVTQGKYETSSDLNKIGVLSAKDMTTESVITKLMYLDGICTSVEEKKTLFIKSLRGEISN